MLKSAFGRFRLISIIEGLSFLLLVFVAMPIKYLGDNPIPVKIVGMGHGVLFILFCMALFHVMYKCKWSKGFGVLLFIYSLIPFGFIMIEKAINKQKKD